MVSRIALFIFSLWSILWQPPQTLADTVESRTLSLQEAITTALAQHPTLRIGQTAIEAAQARVRQQVAGYLPRGAYTYAYTRQERPSTSATGGVQVGEEQRSRSSTQLFNFNSTNFSLSQLLFDFGRTLASIRAAAAEREASSADLQATRETVIFNTRQAYYGLLSSQRLLQVAEETVQQNRRHLEDAQARVQVGVAPRFDVTQAQVQVATAELNLVTARNNVALGQETLRTAMGVPPPATFTVTDAAEHRSVTVDEEAVFALASATRPELQSVAAQQRAAAERVSAVRRQYLPSVTGTAQYSWTGREYPLQEGWLWGVTLTVPLFDSILTSAQEQEALANLRNLVAQSDDLRQQIALEVRQSILSLRQTKESIRVSERALQQAQENIDLAEGRYRAGVGSIIELTDAQVSLSSAQASRVQALYAYQIAIAQLERAMGRPLD